MLSLIVAATAVGVFLAAGAFIASIDNHLVALNNVCDNGFAQIEVQLKRRYDLIPHLVACAKGYLRDERETLENVMAARNQASAGLAPAAQSLGRAAARQEPRPPDTGFETGKLLLGCS